MIKKEQLYICIMGLLVLSLYVIKNIKINEKISMAVIDCILYNACVGR